MQRKRQQSWFKTLEKVTWIIVTVYIILLGRIFDKVKLSSNFEMILLHCIQSAPSGWRRLKARQSLLYRSTVVRWRANIRPHWLSSLAAVALQAVNLKQLQTMKSSRWSMLIWLIELLHLHVLIQFWQFYIDIHHRLTFGAKKPAVEKLLVDAVLNVRVEAPKAKLVE